MLSSVQISGEEVGPVEINDICESLRSNSIRLLALRGCRIEDKHFQRLMESLKANKSLAQLNLNLGVANSKERFHWLANGLLNNRSLEILFLHGSPLEDEGLAILMPVFSTHPNLKSIDIGDCKLTDEGIRQVSTLLPHTSTKCDLRELTLTGNKNVTQSGWTQLAMAIANGCTLRRLFIDYNNLGDFGAGCFAVALAGCRTLEILDLDCCNITDAGAELIFDLVSTYKLPLQRISLNDNNIGEDLISDIKGCIAENQQ